MIGVNILAYPQQFLATFDSGGDIAAHTWTHPYMTTLSNLDILGQVRSANLSVFDYYLIR